MKKLISVFLALLIVFGTSCFAFATDASDSLRFDSDGKFRILMINDTQDVGKGSRSETAAFINAALDRDKPDLVVFVGDQLADMYPNATKEDYKLAIDKIIKPLQERNVPFLVTLGNHDHDRADVMSEDEMFEVYASYDNCLAIKGSNDPFTYNVPVYSSNGDSVKFNIYMMDTNNKKDGGYEGIRASQLEWYNQTSAALKAANGGKPVPSLLFQHVPVKEVYSLFTECKWYDENAVYSSRDSKWYILNENMASGDLGEAPCSENFDVQTGQYQAWVENGDIIGAFFAHDHVNNFIGTTDDGITMGYNGGTGFRAYGADCGRTMRVFDICENDVENYDTHLIYYQDLVGKKGGNLFFDTFSPSFLNSLMKIAYFFFGWVINLAKA